MSLKIRCPHCRRVLTAERETIGEPRRCPACNRAFTVPIPLDELVTARTEPRCVKCGEEIGLTTAVCRKCYTDQATGKRLSFSQRLRQGSKRAWVTVGATVGVLCIAAAFGWRFYSESTRPKVATYVPPSTVKVDAAGLVERLLAAGTQKERAAARDEIMRADAAVGAALLEGLVRSLREEATPEGGRGQLAALELLGSKSSLSATIDEAARAALVRAEEHPALRNAAIRARCALGDADGLRDLLDLWLEQTQSLMFVERFTALTPKGEEGRLSAYRDRLRGEAARSASVLKALIAKGERPVLETLGEDFWTTLAWLGQVREEGFARALFELAKPAEGKNAPDSKLDFNAEEIRGARRALKQMADRGGARAKAAAALVLLDCTPQYESLRNEIMTGLVRDFGGMKADEQPVVAWTLARLSKRVFGGFGAERHPLDLTAADREALVEWARREHGATRPERLAGLPGPPVLEFQVISAKRQLEQELLAAFAKDTGMAEAALDRWMDVRLGWTPRLDALIDPTQRSPKPTALAAAITLAGATGEARLRRQLELWREAPDQPPEIRALAYLALGVLDAREGAARSGWPRGFSLGAWTPGGGSAVTWSHLAKLLSAGGKAMQEQLEKSGGLSAGQLDKLSEALQRERAAGRVGSAAK